MAHPNRLRREKDWRLDPFQSRVSDESFSPSQGESRMPAVEVEPRHDLMNHRLPERGELVVITASEGGVGSFRVGRVTRTAADCLDIHYYGNNLGQEDGAYVTGWLLPEGNSRLGARTH